MVSFYTTTLEQSLGAGDGRDREPDEAGCFLVSLDTAYKAGERGPIGESQTSAVEA